MVAIWLTMSHKSACLASAWVALLDLKFLSLSFVGTQYCFIIFKLSCMYCFFLKITNFDQENGRNLDIQKHVKRENKVAWRADERGINVKFILSALLKCILPNNNNNQINNTNGNTKSVELNNNEKFLFPVVRLTFCRFGKFTYVHLISLLCISILDGLIWILKLVKFDNKFHDKRLHELSKLTKYLNLTTNVVNLNTYTSLYLQNILFIEFSVVNKRSLLSLYEGKLYLATTSYYDNYQTPPPRNQS